MLPEISIILNIVLAVAVVFVYRRYRKNIRKVQFILDAVAGGDYNFKYFTGKAPMKDALVNTALNRIVEILARAKSDAQMREKYYELILESVDTGIIVIDERGHIIQKNSAALRLLGLSVFTHVSQLDRVDGTLMAALRDIRKGEKKQVEYGTEKGAQHLSVRASGMLLQDKEVRIVAVSDINSELEEKEIDSWIRLTRVLTHEIMNSVTPITSISETMLRKYERHDDIRNGLETIHTTGRSLIGFVENYRKFTHIPTPVPSLFYVRQFAERMRSMALSAAAGTDDACMEIVTDISPSDLILYADESLVSHIVLNLLRNAMQAITGAEQKDGRIVIRARCDEAEAVIIDICNNGPLIPREDREQIFVPFFTTKPEGSGIGLSISRQIMRLSGGTLTLHCDDAAGVTTFTLKFP